MLLQVDVIMQRTRALWSLLEDEVRSATTDELLAKPGDRWSARDSLVHIGNWEEEGVVYFDSLFTEQPFAANNLPIDEWNAQHLAKYAQLDMDGVMAYLRAQHQALEAYAERITEAQMNGNPSFRGLLLMTPDHVAGHLHQIREAVARARGDEQGAGLHYLAYARQRVLTRLNLEYRPVASLEWRPAEGKWNIKEQLIHLSLWDRHWVGLFDAVAADRPLPGYPCPPEELDRYNQEQVAARSWWSLAETLHEFGAARGALMDAYRRLTLEQAMSEPVRQRLERSRKHDDMHMYSILKTLGEWRKVHV